MLRDVFYYGAKPNVHPREQFANNLNDARKKCTTEHFWIVNEYCDYTNFDWDFDFDFLPDEDVWAQDHNNVWPSQHQKDSGTWLCSKIESDIIIYRTDVSPVKRKNEKNGFWKVYTPIDEKKFDFSWHPDPTDPLFIFVWGNKYINGVFEPTVEYHTPGAIEKKYMFQHAPVLPQWERWHILKEVDKTTFDFTWRPDPREPPYIYTWGNKYEPAEITPTLEYRCPGATQVKYMIGDVDVLPQWDRWEIPDNVDKSSFDFSWRPDPREPALIYEFGTQWQKTGGPRYVMPEATEVKYIDVQYAKVLSNTTKDNWVIPDNIDITAFDFSWHPDSTDEPYIYQFGTQHQKTGGPRYVVKNATQIKYIDVVHAKALPNKDRWIVPDNLDVSEFDFSWHPDDTDPPFIYDAGTQWQKTGGPRYIVEGATQLKYLENKKAKALPNKENWYIPVYIDEAAWDFSWHPDITEPAYIYYFPTQWALSGGPVYTVPGGTENKFLEGPIAKAVINMDNWEIPNNIDKDSFDFSWHPFAQDDPCIYQIGTQWQKTGGPRYITPGTNELSPVKYIDRRIIKSKILPDKTNFKFLHPIVEEEFDFSWHPDSTEEPYTYIFGNQHWGAEKMHTVEYHVEGATQYKYVHNLKAKLKPNRENWQIKINIDESAWDFSWVPDPGEPPYIYVFGNQWHNAEIESTIEYHVPGATEYKYMNGIKATVLPDMTNWKFNYKIDESKFDFSWRPDPGSPPYIYSFGSNLYPAEEMSTVEYHVPGATEYKYIPEIIAQLAEDKSKWVIPNNVDVTDFDFTWHPNPKDPKYIYYAGTQWQKTGGPKYVVEGATEIKYLEGKKVKALPDKTNWVLPTNVDVADFDFSWHPDETEPPYIYQFGTQWALSGGPKYVMPNATEVKYMENPVAKAIPDKTNWIIPKNIDANNFDFSWHPYVEDQPYIYVFGTQWQKTGGPRYVTPGANEMSPVKYIDRRIIKSKSLPDKTNWEIPANIDPNSVDYSWHPDDTEQPYIYEFGTQWHDRGGPKYVVPDATVMKYSSDIKGNLIRERKNWEVLTPIIESKFDFTWHPHPNDPPYIYVFGNNLYPAEEMETVRYVVEGATQVKYVNDVVAQLAPDRTNWEVSKDVDVSEFDFSWRPHPKAPPYIYEFGTQWQKTGGPRYVVDGAKEVNYISGSKAIYKPKVKSKYWEIPKSLDIREFDFSWHPDSTDKPYIYQFGTQWALSGGPRFVVPGATEVKYIDKPVAKMRGSKKNWEIPNDVDVNDFDFSWHPYEDDRPYIYQFGTQWQKTGGPRYITPGADEMSTVKYIDRRILKAKKLPNKKNFTILNNNIVEDFDYSWHPDDTDPAYIYVFGNNLYPGEVMPTIKYVVEGAAEVKYISEIVAKLGPNKKNWIIPDNIDDTGFDYSWVPNPTEPAFIYEFGTQWQKTGGPRYVIEGATETKYMDFQKVKALPNKDNFVITNGSKIADFDYSWHPDSTDPPYIYVFGNEKYSAEIMPTVQYTVEGAQTIKYVSDVKAKLGVNMSNWKVADNIDKTSFDFSWVPDPLSPPYIYEFATVWNDRGGPIYTVPGATEKKYITDIEAKLLPSKNNWNIVIPIQEDKFDFSWVPHPDSPPYIYVFGNQWNKAEKESTVEYRVPGATEYKYIHDIIATTLPIKDNWKINIPVDKSFDFSWRPDPNDPPYIYVFGNQWNKAEKESTVEYIVPGATDKKYIQDIIANVAENLVNWKIPTDVDVSDFDFSWRPDSGAPPYIYQFGTLENDNDGPIYHTPENKGEIVRLRRVYKKHSTGKTSVGKYFITTTLQDLAEQHPDELFWALRENIDYTNFDFDWAPNIEQARYVHVFGSPESEITQTYFVSGPMWKEGYRDFNFVEQDKKASEEYLAELFIQPDIFFVDRGNPESLQRFEQLKARFTNISKTRFLNSWVDTINRCINRSNTELCWILNSELDYTDFDFKYYPNPWQMKMVHVFGTQWSHWGTTFMVNRETFSEDTKYIKIIEHLSNLNFVKDRRARATNNLYDIYVINHGNKELNQVVDSIKLVAGEKSVNVVDYDKTYLQTIKNIVDNINPRKEHYIWICSSICNYSNFDFTYICDPFARENLHVFPSDMQKFGDTFFINVNHTKKVISELEILQQYNKVNFNNTVRSKRLPAPVIKVNTDTHVGSIDTNFDFPYAIFTTEEFKANDTETLNLWQDDTKELLVTSTGASRIIVPKEAKNYIKNELYDYPYIKTASKLLSSKPLDIVFLSNGEKNAEENYKHLLAVTEGLKNRIVRVDGVNGRVDAYHAAVKASETPWAFTVFAKLKVNGKFDWGWQPDRLQVPKHYIFHAKNPVNGLEYGHQGMIAYNKQLVLNNFGSGLDFTLDDPHETVELVSGTANFNTDAYSTWRTAFREVIKLKSDYTEISQERLNIWLTEAKGKFAKDCLQGAKDAVEYYEEVSGDMDQLKLSYEWSWLKDFYNRKYK